MREDITKRIDALNDELVTRQEPINILKGRLNNQITSFREMIAKVLDSNTSLAEKIQMLFREYIRTILRATSMMITLFLVIIIDAV